MSEEPHLPNLVEVRALAKKARAKEAFTDTEYQWVLNVLSFVERDSMYWFKQGSRKEPRV